MSKEYIPLRHELTVVETIRWLPDNPVDMKKLMDELIAKYGNDVKIDVRKYTETHWSWRADSSYTTNEVEYQVKAIRPVYSDEDTNAMHNEYRQKSLDDFQKKYAHLLKPVDRKSK